MRPVATLALAYMLVTLPAAAEVTTVNISHRVCDRTGDEP